MNGIEGRLSPAWLDYLSGLTLDPTQVPPRSNWGSIAPNDRRLALVKGVGVRVGDEDENDNHPLDSEALLTGLAGEYLPFAFELSGSPSGVRIAMGTWGPSGSTETQVDEQQHVITGLLEGLYPYVDWEPVSSNMWGDMTAAALAHGMPGRIDDIRESPWDRILRSMRGQRFGIQVLAEPMAADALVALRSAAMEDLRAVMAGEAGVTTPLLTAYVHQMDELVEGLERALAVGGWRVGVHLLGDEGSLWRLCAVWRAAFADNRRQFLPVRVNVLGDVLDLATGWVLPYLEAPRGPGRWRHPFMHQTLLDTTQLASMAHLPRHESPGFTIRPAPAFAVARPLPQTGQPAIRIGQILQQGNLTGGSYDLELNQLTRHAFVAGLTGSGKTNTIMHLLQEASRYELPFLVIEPAKTEYRELLSHPTLAKRLRVFTLGRERLAPLRINPFEVPPGVDVGTHLDLLKPVFASSFALWIPLPQILEQCLVELYTERGWEFGGGARPLVTEGVHLPVPTLSDLVRAVERTVPTLGYKTETMQEITASLTTRLNSLRRGVRGAMLDVEQSTSVEELLNGPVVIELEGLGDDADKAFVMGLLLIRLYEHRRAERSQQLAASAMAGHPAPESGRLRHVVVVEEAHRLLAQSNKHVDAWHADAQGSFADTFSQMLAEARAYGQAVVIADQVPVRLAPDVIKNTNLKIAHRLVAGDDRDVMASAMSMDGAQSRSLATLTRGQALVFSEGDHIPVVVAVSKSKDLGNGPAIDDLAVARRAVALGLLPVADGSDGAVSCIGRCRNPAECADARRQAEEPEGLLLGWRLFTTACLHIDGLDVMWPDLIGFVSARLPEPVSLDRRASAFAVHASYEAVSRLAIRRLWDTRRVEALRAALHAALTERAASGETWLGPTAARLSLVDLATEMLKRTRDPYPMCGTVCPDGTCRYREGLHDIMAHPRQMAAIAAIPQVEETPAERVARIAEGMAREVVSNDTSAPSGATVLVEASWRALGCAAQIASGGDDRPRQSAKAAAEAMTQAGWSVSTDDEQVRRWAIALTATATDQVRSDDTDSQGQQPSKERTT